MKVQFTDPADFICEVRDIIDTMGEQAIRGGVIRWRKERAPEQKEGVTFLVGLWITAVVDPPDSEPTLLECAWEAGTDRAETGRKPAESPGSDAVEEVVEQLRKLETERLRIRPGKIELF